MLLSVAIFGELPWGMTKLKKDDTFCANVVVVVFVIAVVAVVQGSGIDVSFVLLLFFSAIQSIPLCTKWFQSSFR